MAEVIMPQQHLTEEVVVSRTAEELVVRPPLLPLPAVVSGKIVSEDYSNNHHYGNEEEEKDSCDDDGKLEHNKSSVYLDKDGGKWRCRECIWTYQIGNPSTHHHIHFGINGESSKAAEIKPSSAEIGNVAEIQSLVKAAMRETTEDEIIELEFYDKIRAKMHTHSAYCPHCRTPISKVVLRIKRETQEPKTDDHGNKWDLVGCLACFRVFLPSCVTNDDKGSSGITQEKQDEGSALDGKCLALSWIFGTAKTQTHEEQSSESSISSEQGQKSTHDWVGKQSPKPGIEDVEEHDDDLKKNPRKPPKSSGESIFDLTGRDKGYVPGVIGGGASAATSEKPELGMVEESGEVKIPIPDEGGPSTSTFPKQEDPKPETQERGSSPSKSIEVIKSIVYGGLAESIASLSVVSSAAASGATTLNVMTIGLANLIGGLFVIINNVFDLYKNRPEEEYMETLGQKNNFLLHAFAALLSYLIFGLAPPAVYGFTFRESDDRDFKIIAVAAASFLSILILAVGKAYTRGTNTFGGYFVTVLQYVTAAAAASGVAFAVGELFERFMEQVGWFNKPSNVVDNNLLVFSDNVKSPNVNYSASF